MVIEMHIDIERIKQQTVKFAAIGQAIDGSISRVFGSEYYEKASIEMKEYMEEVGMVSYIDSVGNVHGLLKCEKKDAQEIVIGSHLDTVKEGGIFDGLLGIIVAVEIVRELILKKQLGNYHVHVVATNGEEGNELGGTFGSRAMMGMLELESEEFLTKALTFGYTEEDLKQAIYDTTRCKCYLEMHVEQGRTLDELNIPVGIVTGIVGLERYQIEVNGISNHAGTTMMTYRDDAVVKGAKLIDQVDLLARDMGQNLVATFSKINISPNALAVINHQMTMILECRNENLSIMQQFIDSVEVYVEELTGTHMQETVKKAPVTCDEQIIETIERICVENDTKYIKMPSGATHDGNFFAKKMPIGMVFVPSIGGMSHSKEENTAWEDIQIGADVLLKTVVDYNSKSKEDEGC
ncbi:MAG: hydantoinase/carbamoylase family amidase [Eubacteriales bacterium]